MEHAVYEVIGMDHGINTLVHERITYLEEVVLGLGHLHPCLIKHFLIVKGCLYLGINGKTIYAAVHRTLIHQHGQHIGHARFILKVHEVSAVHKLLHGLWFSEHDVRRLPGSNIVFIGCNIG